MNIINHSYFGYVFGYSVGAYLYLPKLPLFYVYSYGFIATFFKHDSGLAVSGNISSSLRNYSPSGVNI